MRRCWTSPRRRSNAGAIGHDRAVFHALTDDVQHSAPILQFLRRALSIPFIQPDSIHIMKTLVVSLSLFVAALSLPALAADTQRQAEVAKLGADVMPFSLKATNHIFTKSADGGTQRVVARNAADAQQVKLVREHLRDIQARFLKGDYSAPSHIHGAEMPGRADLQAARPGQVDIAYKDVKAGAELTYRTADARLVAALHQWFDAQLSDHGADAMAGHMHHDHGAMTKP